MFDKASRSHFTLPYAVIVTTQSGGPDNGADAPVPAKPTPPPEIASRAGFRVGNRVSFTDQNLQHRVGLIVRINLRTATMDCDGQTWRVGFLFALVNFRPASTECMVRHARTMLTDIHQAHDELTALSSGSEGKIHIGVFPASTSVLLPQALVYLKQRSPGTNAMVTDGTTNTLLPELWQGRLHMVVGRLPAPNTHNGFEEMELLEEPVMLITVRHHPLANKKKLKWLDLNAYPWVLPPTGSLLRDPLERALRQHDVQLGNNDIETLLTHLPRACLHISDAIGVIAGAAANDIAQPLAILPLSLPKMMRPAGVLWNRNRGLSSGGKLMVSCREEAAYKLRDVYAIPAS